MDEAATHDHVQKHADAVVRGDMDTVTADFSGGVTIRTTWQDKGGRPVIVQAEPAS